MYRICPKKKIVTKVQRWKEKHFSELVDSKEIGIDERLIEAKMSH